MACRCDYSYTCSECQEKIDVENQLEYQKEQLDWILNSIKEIATKVGAELPPEPKKRGLYDY